MCLAEDRAQLWHRAVALAPLELLADGQCGGGYMGVCQAVVDPQEAGFKLRSFPRLREESRGRGSEKRGQDGGRDGLSDSGAFQVCVFTRLLSTRSLRERWEWGRGCTASTCRALCALPVQQVKRGVAAGGGRAGRPEPGPGPGPGRAAGSRWAGRPGPGRAASS